MVQPETGHATHTDLRPELARVSGVTAFLLVGGGAGGKAIWGGKRDACLDFEGNTVLQRLGFRPFQAVPILLC